MAFLLNEEAFVREMEQLIKVEMESAAEPIIQKALIDIEKELRKGLAKVVVGAIESSFNVERYGQDLRIMVYNERKGTQ